MISLNPGPQFPMFVSLCCCAFVKESLQVGFRGDADVTDEIGPKRSKCGHVTGRGKCQSLEILEEAEV